MPLKLEIISDHRDIVGDDAVREFRAEGGTIGRSLTSDWILPDPDKFISGKHATIDCKSGVYYIVDISTNGVYVNDECKPIGKDSPRRLFNGDHLHLGDFELMVSIDEGEDLEMPAEQKPTVVPDHIEQLVEEDRIRTDVELLDEDEITGDMAFESMLRTGDNEKLLEEPQDPEPALLQPTAPRPSRAEGSGDDLFSAFLDGLQISRAELRASLDVEVAMHNAGAILREFIEGTEKLLENRADVKRTFGLDQTTILPRHSNPFKLSQNTDDLVRQLLVGHDGEYPGSRDAVQEVCQDLLAHQEAFLDAMSQAFIDFADRFDPEELAASFDYSLGRKPFFRLLNDLKYWGLYRDLYPSMTEKGSGRFPQMFAEEFVTAYERCIIESRREYRLSNELTKVKLEPLSEDARRVEQAASVKPTDQAEDAPQKSPGAVLDEIAEPRGLHELVDFDDLETRFDTVVFDDDAGQAKG